MQTVFVRHNCASTPGILKALWERRLIALHYHDDFSTKPSDYNDAGRKALTRLWHYCQSGAIVGADFRKLTVAKMLVGELRANSKVRAEEFKDAKTGESYIYKVVELINAKEIAYADFPLLLGVQPRQATITGWPSGRNVLESAFYGKAIEYSVSNLHPSQLEVLCFEWMRTQNLIDKLLLPIGRGLLDIDVLGINSKGHRVLGQITHSTSKTDLEDKQARLLQHARRDDHCYFFMPDGTQLQVLDRVKCVSINQVFDDLKNMTDVPTINMLQEMFHSSR